MTEKLIVPEPEDVAVMAVDLAINDLRQAIETYGQATWVIAGGSTPLAAYRLLAAKMLDAVDWSKVTIVIGDERVVPFDSPDSNWKQAFDALLCHVQLSEQTVRPATDGDAELAAEAYEEFMLRLPHDYKGLPRLDHVWLGVGEDGHTLSLFPEHASLDSTDRLVVAIHDSPKPPAQRISLTLKALQGAAHCVIMSAGAGKAAIIAKLNDGDRSLPVSRAAATVEAAGGKVTWLLDESAAGQQAD